VHCPDSHVSGVQALLSRSHEAPGAFSGLLQTPLLALHVPTEWHWSEALQTTGLPPEQFPDWQVSVRVQALPSSHWVPLSAGFEQVPLAGLQVPTPWHWSAAIHVTGLEPLQDPDWQVSVSVHLSPSLHAVPLAALGFEQLPLVGSHVPATWHMSLAVHVFGLPAVQPPAWQVSDTVQGLPSLQASPFAFAGFEQVPVVVLQMPAVWH
jgi:hypothetical protein